MMKVDFKVIAKSALAIAAATAFVAILGYMNSGDASLLNYATNTTRYVLITVVFVTAIINIPRFVRRR